MKRNAGSLADDVLRRMMDRIRSGEWKPGTVIPSQRQLVNDLGVSGVPLREALSMMKTLGVLEIRQGRKSVVRRMDTDVLQQLFPLGICLELEDEQSFNHISELRLALEPRTAGLAAERRTQDDLDALLRLTQALRAHHSVGGNEFFDADLAFHLRVAEATGNPLFPLLLKSISGFVFHAQHWGCNQVVERRLRAVWSHESIYDAILNRDAQRAVVEMEAHLRYSATHYLPEENSEPLHAASPADQTST